MATAKKNGKTKTKTPPAKVTATPAEPAAAAATGPAMAARAKILICDKVFWADVASAIPTMMVLEFATKGMDRKAFEDFLGRYKLNRIDVWESEFGNTQIRICDGGKVLGDWL